MTNNYYQKHKEKLQKEGHERYQNLSGEEKDKRRKKAREKEQKEQKGKKCQYFQESKQKLPEYRRNYYLTLELLKKILLVLE